MRANHISCAITDQRLTQALKSRKETSGSKRYPTDGQGHFTLCLLGEAFVVGNATMMMHHHQQLNDLCMLILVEVFPRYT